MLTQSQKLLFIVLGLAFGAPICAMDLKGLSHKLKVLAMTNGTIDEYRCILDQGVDINYRDPATMDTPLTKAARFDRLDMVNELIARGANLNLQNEKGDTALIVAATWGRDEMVKALIQSGADIYIDNSAGYTALLKVIDSRIGSEQAKINIVLAILNAAILSTSERDSIRNWLLVNERLRQEGKIFLPKDPRTLVAQRVYQMPSGADLLARVFRAGGGRISLRLAKRRNLPKVVQILEQYLDPAFLEQRLRSMLPPMLRQRNP